MQCNICGQEYLTTHSCAGPIVGPPHDQIVPSAGFALFHYIGEGWRMVRWDDAAIHRVKDDRRELPYGILIWAAANVVAVLAIASYTPAVARDYWGIGGLLTLGLLLVRDATFGLVQMGSCHLLAKWFCAGDGEIHSDHQAPIVGFHRVRGTRCSIHRTDCHGDCVGLRDGIGVPRGPWDRAANGVSAVDRSKLRLAASHAFCISDTVLK
jgi:hypothetical protein